jgi:hypothetical protein
MCQRASHPSEHQCVEIDVDENLVQQYLKGKSLRIKNRKEKFIAIHIIPRIIIETMNKEQMLNLLWNSHDTLEPQFSVAEFPWNIPVDLPFIDSDRILDIASQ